MSFQAEHDKWISTHLKQRTGERLDALKRGHGFGNRLFVEQVWWPLAGHLDGLHPEYEVKDWRGRSYFVDLVWIVGSARIAFEVMDFGSHGTDRTKYRLDMNRGLFLQTQGFQLHCIALDELKENPSFIASALRQVLSPYWSSGAAKGSQPSPERAFSKLERDLMRAAIRHNRLIKPAAAARELELHTATVIKYCRLLADKGKFRPVAKGESGRVTYYEYTGSIQSPDLV